MIEINLIPDVKQELIKAQKIRTKVIAGSIVIGVISVSAVTLLAVYVFGGQSARSFFADQDIKKYSEQLEKVPDLSKMLTIQNQLTKISDLNGSKKIDSRIFDLLKAVVPKAPNDVVYSSLVIDAGNSTISIDGQAANGYSAVEIFRKTIEGAQIKYDGSEGVVIASEVNTSNLSYGEDTSGEKVLRFTLSFVYAPELFSPASKNAAIVIPNRGSNATDSYLGVPDSLFANRAQDITTEEVQ
jgi:hypothetical protein